MKFCLVVVSCCFLLLFVEARRGRQPKLVRTSGGDDVTPPSSRRGRVDVTANPSADDWDWDDWDRGRDRGRRVSSWRRWMEQFRPHRLHGAVQVGPGLDIRFDSDFGFNWDVQAKWWLGENVCERTLNSLDEEVPTGSNRTGGDRSGGRQQSPQLLYSRTCNGTGNEYRCTTMRVQNGRKTVTTTVYECCPGYKRSQDESGGHCSEEVVLTDTGSTLQTLGALEMERALNVTGMLDRMHLHNYTVFAPTDEAFTTYEPLQDANLHVVRVSPENINSITNVLNDIVSGHVIQGIIRTNDFVDDQLYETTLKVGTVRLNKYNMYPQPVLTANCVPLVNADVMTTHGVVHVVERVLPPTQRTLEQLVLHHPQLSIFANVARHLGLSESGPFTLFAPSNDAFNQLDVSLRNKLLSPDGCELEILRQHILPRVLCSASITPGFRVKTLNSGSRYMTLARMPDVDQLTVEGANTTETDMMATNGVLHIVDKVLFLKAADKLLDVAKNIRGVSKFLRLVEQTGVSRRLNAMNNFTMFIPTDDAVQAIADQLDNMTEKDKEQMVENHIVPRRLLSRDVFGDQQLPTLHHRSELHVKHYHSFPFGVHSRKTVQCATLRTFDINNASVCSGVGHIVDRVLLPAKQSVLDALSDSKFSNLMQLLKSTGLADRLQQQDSTVTFFAPTNKAFEALSENTLNTLQENTDIARHVLLSHMLPDVLCCAGVFPRNVFQLPVREVNLDGWMIPVDRTSHSVHFGSVPIQSCDQMAANGIVHAIDKFAPMAIDRYIDDEDESSLHTLWSYVFNP